MTNTIDRLTDRPSEVYVRALADARLAYLRATDTTYEGPQNRGWYLAGKMSGIKSFNFPAFDEAATHLRKCGYLILSPAEMDDQEARAEAMASPDGAPGRMSLPRSHFLRRDFFIVMDAEGVICLENWKQSPGALDETRLAMSLDKPVLAYPNLSPIAWKDHPYSLSEVLYEVG